MSGFNAIIFSEIKLKYSFISFIEGFFSFSDLKMYGLYMLLSFPFINNSSISNNVFNVWSFILSLNNNIDNIELCQHSPL